ncbi:hypothetical protein C0Q70_20800 [Pomacea canaliculata]|uniref:Uncharacterized protein n=1 Tax=Pomacea canaliculata TaxID=400727 RepID=A0A2T7NAR5_POMCA|nr:hypothetical protein C0Q70_20800 [Pomacea canaliculata]
MATLHIPVYDIFGRERGAVYVRAHARDRERETSGESERARDMCVCKRASETRERVERVES